MQRKGLTTLSRGPTKALEITTFALHVEDVPGEVVPSPRGQVMIVNLLFSLMKIEKPGYFHVWHLERWERKTLCLYHAACRGRWGVCVLYRKGGPVPASCRVSAFLGFYWMICSCQLPLLLVVSSVITATFLTFLLLVSLLMLSFLSPVVFCFLFLASLLCPNPFEVLPSFSLGNNSFPRFYITFQLWVPWTLGFPISWLPPVQNVSHCHHEKCSFFLFLGLLMFEVPKCNLWIIKALCRQLWGTFMANKFYEILLI